MRCYIIITYVRYYSLYLEREIKDAKETVQSLLCGAFGR